MKPSVVTISALLVVTGAWLSPAAAQTPLSASFTYQGSLTHSGLPATGTADMRFKLWDAATGGSQLGTTKTFDGAGANPPPVALADGLFSVELNFGAAAYNGDERWLEIAVRNPAGTGAYTTLAPRQHVTAAPYAIQTRGLYVNQNNWLGIGTTAPQNPLHVVGNGDVMALEGTNHAYMELFPGGFAAGRKAYMGFPANGVVNLVLRNETAGGNLILNAPGNVGVGYTDGFQPTARLEVNGSLKSASLSVIGASSSGSLNVADATQTNTLSVTDEITLPGGVIRVGGATPDTNDLGLYSLNNGNWMRLVTNNAPIQFYTNSAEGTAAAPGFDSAAMTISEDGSVGIGTGSPVARLDVAGVARVDVLQIDSGADVAENYDIAASSDDKSGVEPRPGMVVSIDPRQVGKLVVSAQPYDRRVAGVISGAGDVRPGLVLSQPGTVADGAFPVASVGRVWCLADAAVGGPVEAGDMLTSSSTPGHAMRAGDTANTPGAVIGKAMSSLKEGRGLVLVLVSLQ